MTKPPKKIANIERREREFLTPHEIDQLIDASKKQGRHSHRDATMILLAYRHGLVFLNLYHYVGNRSI